jgi:hypothetical protein
MIVSHTSSRQNCAPSTHVWVADGEDAFCIRFFTNHVKPTTGAAIFFFNGDFLASDWDSTGHSKGVLFDYKGETGLTLFKKTNALVEQPRHLALVYVSRPGTTGSSGDHKYKYWPQESHCLDSIRDSVDARIALGQSRGAVARHH